LTKPQTQPNKDIDYDAMSFGRYLKALRLEKGLNIETVSSETRIPLETVEAIEAEDHDKLPDQVFVKGFLRAYAKLVDANPDATVQRYLANYHLKLQTARYEADLIRSGERFWVRLIISFWAIACLVFISVWLTSRPDASQKPVSKKEATPANRQDEAPPATPAASEQVTPPPVASAKALVIVGVSETWVKLIIDDQTPKKFTLSPGDRLEFTAENGFNLLIGNAAGVKLMFNNAPAAVPGKQGQMVTLRLP
jgi:cytoskeleton protein RodZ